MRLLLSLLLLFASLASVAEGAQRFEPTLPPGYAPDKSTDEGGLWYQVERFEEQLQTSPHIIRNTALTEYLEELVCQLAGDYCGSIRVYLVKNPHFNASMYPNGMMHVHTGLLLRVANADELGAVLGHELAHYLRSHSIDQWRNAKKSLGIAAFIDIGLAALHEDLHGLARDVATVGLMRYNREQESEADAYGVQIIATHGYDPAASVSLWKYIEAERGADKSKDTSSIFFATHPKVENRIARLKQHIKRYGKNPKTDETDLDEFQNLVVAEYEGLMDEQIALQEYEQTAEMIDRHAAIGYPDSLIKFYRAELHRQRKKFGDERAAIDLYRKAATFERTAARSHRELGYLYIKHGLNDAAKDAFESYLEITPNADDREMINFYLETLR
ncbi:MAG: M48 family metalloprotease [Cellvibrionales bacterium]|nr:M48 family metalloprotease [Cellvibrionales bacterium]